MSSKLLVGSFLTWLALHFFVGWLFILIKLEKQKLDEEKKSPLINKNNDYWYELTILYKQSKVYFEWVFISTRLNSFSSYYFKYLQIHSFYYWA